MSNLETYPEKRSAINRSLKKLTAQQTATMQGFGKLHAAATATSALDSKTKELIALSISVALRCDGCIAFHTHDALKAGATEAEITDALSVAMLMGGGPAMVYATHVMDAIEQFNEVKN